MEGQQTVSRHSVCLNTGNRTTTLTSASWLITHPRCGTHTDFLTASEMYSQKSNHNKCYVNAGFDVGLFECFKLSDIVSLQIPSEFLPKVLLSCTTQDFVIYLLAGPIISFGRQSEGGEGSKTDFHLFAADILPRHCCFHRLSNGSATTLQPGQGSLVTRNGEVLETEVQLHPGDIITLGQHYLFLFKDPLALADKVSKRNVPNFLVSDKIHEENVLKLLFSSKKGWEIWT